MIKSWQGWFQIAILKWLAFIALIAWAATSTVYAVRSRPRIILIGLDDNGTRLITSQNDPLLKSERIKFVRDFLFHFYNYTSENYGATVSHAGSFMADTLWEEKKPELQRIETQMKVERITQETRLLDLRVVSESEVEADLDVTIRHRLVDKNVKYRVAIKLGPRKRSTENPYAWEVTAINEIEIR
jgi:hypothetical protein